MVKILFVCTGNICRSAMAHHYMQKKIIDNGLGDKYLIDSAGISAYTGDSATDSAKEVMKKYGVDMEKHRATYLEEADIKSFDLVLCMTMAHKRKILNRYPNMQDKVFTLKEYVGETYYLDIDDPWGFGIEVYEACSEEIVNYVDKLVEKLSRGE